MRLALRFRFCERRFCFRRPQVFGPWLCMKHACRDLGISDRRVDPEAMRATFSPDALASMDRIFERKSSCG